VYIDCEGSFTPERVQQMASAVSTHLSKLARNTSSSKPGWVEAAAELTPELICSRIHCFRVHSHEDQIAAVRQLPDFLTDHPGVLLVVLDSVAFHFRHAYANDIGLRSRMLSKMAQQLNEVSYIALLYILIHIRDVLICACNTSIFEDFVINELNESVIMQVVPLVVFSQFSKLGMCVEI
jgi:RAD51-like protein 2